jgi:hypothetical protein
MSYTVEHNTSRNEMASRTPCLELDISRAAWHILKFVVNILKTLNSTSSSCKIEITLSLTPPVIKDFRKEESIL